jgi:acetylornithine/N-succinyldiaminopimelate aminotransferase
VLAPGFLERVQRVANYARQQLAALPSEYANVFEDVRGQGLMLGLKMKVPNTEFVAKLRARHLLAVGAGGNVVRLLPPLIIDEDQVREAIQILSDAAAEYPARSTEAA